MRNVSFRLVSGCNEGTVRCIAENFVLIEFVHSVQSTHKVTDFLFLVFSKPEGLSDLRLHKKHFTASGTKFQ